MVLLKSEVVLKAGDKAPDFDLLGIDDKKHSLAEYKDYKAKLIIFMCNHCPYVQAKVDAMKTFAKEKGFGFTYLVDETQEIAKKYGAVCTPDPFLFDKDGKLVFHGRIDNAMKPEDKPTEKTMIQNIEKVLSGNKIEKDFDPSMGCSIKWKSQ